MAHFSNIGVTEVFLEATPTTFITTTFLIVSTFYPSSEGLYNVILGGGPASVIMFFVGYAASILSSAFGVSR